jgi:hypothetical protein
MLCTVQCRPASACARKSPPRGCTRRQDKTRQGREFRKLLQILETRRKATRGACYRWHYVVGNASVYVYVHWAKTARQSYGRSQSFWWTRGCGPTTSQSWVLVSLVLCAALHSIPPPPHPPVQVCHVALVLVPATVSVSGFVVVDVGFAFLLLCSSIIIKHGLPPPSFGLARWHTRQCAPAQPPFCGLACVL